MNIIIKIVQIYNSFCYICICIHNSSFSLMLICITYCNKSIFVSMRKTPKAFFLKHLGMLVAIYLKSVYFILELCFRYKFSSYLSITLFLFQHSSKGATFPSHRGRRTMEWQERKEIGRQIQILK